MHIASAEQIAAAERELASRALTVAAEYTEHPEALGYDTRTWQSRYPSLCRAIARHGDLEGWIVFAKERGETRRSLAEVTA